MNSFLQKTNKPIVCFEGPSGVGKTTLCNILLDEYDTIPEVNLLFERKGNEHEFWYLYRQLDRYALSTNSDRISILDGDIFQPIWYNWVYNYPAEFLDKYKTHEYYKSAIKNGLIAFPDLYIVFTAEEKVLRERKENDQTRKRRNFENTFVLLSH